MSVQFCGYEWLKRTYKLDIDSPHPVSKIGGAKSPDTRIFRPQYQPEDTLAEHLLFADKLFEMQKQLVSNPDNGWRTDFGWIGDRLPDATPLPEHISAHPDSLNQALKDFVTRHKRKNMLELVGKVQLDEGYDYKALRRNDG